MLVRKMKKNEAGFSLIELMVVVAIIGILAAIGIPQYAKFQAKARQSEAKSSLSSLYAAEKSFYGEWNQYTFNLKNAGFGVQGTALRYVTGFPVQVIVGGSVYTVTSGAPAEGTLANATNTLSTGSEVNVGAGGNSAATWKLPSGVDSAAPTYAVPSVGTSIDYPNSFTAMAYGSPTNTVQTGDTAQDRWTVTENKLISNTQPGL